MEAIANPPAYDRARAAVRYDDISRALVHSLAGVISGLTGVPVVPGGGSNVCGRRRNRLGKSKTERADNVQGAFRVAKEHESDIAERRLVLIDDVLTSGATVDACARVLSRAGAGHVDVLVFARVVAAARPPI